MYGVKQSKKKVRTKYRYIKNRPKFPAKSEYHKNFHETRHDEIALERIS